MISLKPSLFPFPPPCSDSETNSSRINPDNIKSGAAIGAVSVDYQDEPPVPMSGSETGAGSLQKCSSIFPCFWDLVFETWSSCLLVYSSKSQLEQFCPKMH